MSLPVNTATKDKKEEINMPKYYTCQEAIDFRLWEQEAPISKYDALSIAIPLDSLADNYDEDAPSVRYPESYC